MKDVTLSVIYAIKQRQGSYDKAVIDFYSKYSGCDPKWYGKEILMRIAVDTIRDYMSTVDNPSFLLWELFEFMHFDCKRLHPIVGQDFDDRVREAIWTTLEMQQVRDNGEYVNGFRDLEEDE